MSWLRLRDVHDSRKLVVVLDVLLVFNLDQVFQIIVDIFGLLVLAFLLSFVILSQLLERPLVFEAAVLRVRSALTQLAQVTLLALLAIVTVLARLLDVLLKVPRFETLLFLFVLVGEGPHLAVRIVEGRGVVGASYYICVRVQVLSRMGVR